MLPVIAWGQSSLPRCTAAESLAVEWGRYGVGTDFGAWRHNCFGPLTFPNGHKYVGEFRDNKRHGQGTFTFANGDKYVGEFKDDKRHGQGTFTFANGDKYVGEYKDDKPNGQGANTLANGDKYVGEFRDGKPNGQGTATYANGFKYVGEFRDHKFNGQGSLTTPVGSKYVGEFRDGKYNGQGIEYRSDGSIAKSGQWADNALTHSYALDTTRFPFNPTQVAAVPTIDASKAERDRLAVEIEAERKRRQELEERLAAESKERERLAQEAKERERQVAEAKEREQRTPTTPSPIASPKNPHALIIGNAAYPGSSRLDNPINDAKAIEQKLKSMGFTVTVVTDANRQRLVQAMSQFRKTASNADLSLLFYSGHGVQIFGTNYILPIDVDQSDVAQATIQGVSLNSVVENFLPGKTKIVFLDACRDNPLQRSNDRSVSKGLAPISVAQGTLIAYATKDGQTASDGVGQKNSPFTKALLEHLSDPQDIAVILRKVREKVMTATGGKQQPWEYGSLTGGELVLSGVKR